MKLRARASTSKQNKVLNRVKYTVSQRGRLTKHGADSRCAGSRMENENRLLEDKWSRPNEMWIRYYSV